MIRAKIVISGDVQGAGYRGIIIRTGRKLGLVGNVENIPDGTVKVVCEGEKEKIEELIKSIKIRDEIVDVENIDVRFEDASGEFDGKGFDVNASEKISDLYREMFHGYITSEKYFRVGFKKQDKTLDALKGMHSDINKRFDKTDEKYGDMSKTMKDVHQDLKEMKNLFARLVNHFVKEEK